MAKGMHRGPDCQRRRRTGLGALGDDDVRVAGALRFAVREAALGDVPAGRVERDGARPGAVPDRLAAWSTSLTRRCRTSWPLQAIVPSCRRRGKARGSTLSPPTAVAVNYAPHAERPALVHPVSSMRLLAVNECVRASPDRKSMRPFRRSGCALEVVDVLIIPRPVNGAIIMPMMSAILVAVRGMAQSALRLLGRPGSGARTRS
jgi:hypothetical protein